MRRAGQNHAAGGHSDASGVAPGAETLPLGAETESFTMLPQKLTGRPLVEFPEAACLASCLFQAQACMRAAAGDGGGDGGARQGFAAALAAPHPPSSPQLLCMRR